MAPADLGPTRRPPASTPATEPPPAPTAGGGWGGGGGGGGGDLGPTRSPPASTQATEPPPAPMVWILTTLMSMGRPSSTASVATSAVPLMTSETSNDVPPISTPIRFELVKMLVRYSPPMAPPTGPDRSVWSGRCRADWAVSTPPDDCMM